MKDVLYAMVLSDVSKYVLPGARGNTQKKNILLIIEMQDDKHHDNGRTN